MVEAMEILEMFADLLLARFGIIDKMKWVYYRCTDEMSLMMYSFQFIQNLRKYWQHAIVQI